LTKNLVIEWETLRGKRVVGSRSQVEGRVISSSGIRELKGRMNERGGDGGYKKGKNL
jgi:hypothetical protein